MSTLTELPKSNTKLQYLQKRANDTLSLAAEKAAAHLLNPQAYPLPAGKNLEKALYEFAMALPKRKRDNFSDKFKASINATQAQRKQKYGDLHDVNLRDNRSVAEQVKALPVENKNKITEDDVKTILPKRSFAKSKLPGKLFSGKPKPQQASVDATTLQFIVDNLTCVKTNDLHKDEISLGAFATDNFGTASDKAPFFVGKFKKTDTVGLGGNATLFTFSIDGGSTGTVFPATFIAGLFLVEEDLIHNAALGEKLTAVFQVIGLTLLTVSMGLLFVPGAASVAIVMLIVAGGFNITGHYILPLMIDDFSLAVTDTLVLDAPPAAGDTFNRSLAFSIDSTLLGITKGSYTAAVRWVAS
ncbi:MAG TPA: hypothetical protein VGO58_09360 [Chitinophagaceae bacterium]|jgi:hypothetical protein|nr:hypothetical protein [Chitinophagaceae bacterium]